MLPSSRLSLAGGRLHVVVDGGAAPRPGSLRALARATERISVLRMPEGHHGLDRLTPIAPRVELLVLDHDRDDLGELPHFTSMRSLTLLRTAGEARRPPVLRSPAGGTRG